MANTIYLDTTCPFCGETRSIMVYEDDYAAWQQGALTQVAFPYLCAEDRESLISGICPHCWDKMFGEKSEDEDISIPEPEDEDEDDYDPEDWDDDEEDEEDALISSQELLNVLVAHGHIQANRIASNVYEVTDIDGETWSTTIIFNSYGDVIDYTGA